MRIMKFGCWICEVRVRGNHEGDDVKKKLRC